MSYFTSYFTNLLQKHDAQPEHAISPTEHSLQISIHYVVFKVSCKWLCLQS